MKRSAAIFLYLIFLIVFPGKLFCQLQANNHIFLTSSPVSINNKESTVHRDNIKLDPLKIFFNEISLSYEHFRSSTWIKPSASDLTGIDSIIYQRKAEQISSLNYIVGFHFSSDFDDAVQYKQDINYACAQYADDVGISPFINWGASVKFEYRRYRKTFYYGPNIMEKFVFYNKQYIDNQSGSEMKGLIRLQSGRANIIGIGCSFGSQLEKNRFVTDFYLGVSGRMRLAVRKIYEEQNYMGPNVIFPEPKTENLNRFYPFLSVGIRLGFGL